MVAMRKEQFGNRFRETSHLRGIGLAVVNPLGELWIGRDTVSKDLTERHVGDLSIIFETRKRRKGQKMESHKRNVLGAVAELVNDTTAEQIKGAFVTTDRLRSTPELTFTTSSGIVIQYVVAIGVLGMPPEQFDPQPLDNEIIPVGWMSPEDFLASRNIRPAAAHAVEYLHTHGLIDQALSRYNSRWHPNRRIIPRGFSVSEFYEQREKEHDMKPGVPYSLGSY